MQETATHSPQQTTREQVDDIFADISWQALERRYFGRASSRFYHKLHGKDINKTGRHAQFSPEELEKLRSALLDLSERIQRVAESLTPIP